MRPRPYYRLVGSIGLLVALAGTCTSYLMTGASRPRRGAISVVAYLDDVGPVWPVLTGLAVLAILAGLLVPRFAVAGHSVAFGVLVAYDAALWWGAVVSSTTAGWVTASMTVAVALHAFLLTQAYAKGPRWTPR